MENDGGVDSRPSFNEAMAQVICNDGGVDRLNRCRPRRRLGAFLRTLITCPVCAVARGSDPWDVGRTDRKLEVVAYRTNTMRLRCTACGLRFSIAPRDLIWSIADLSVNTKIELLLDWLDVPGESPEDRLARRNAIIDRINVKPARASGRHAEPVGGGAFALRRRRYRSAS